MEKQKIFLGAYINYLNAQNINCKSIANHLDKSKYDVKTLILSKGESIELQDVQTIKVRNNRLSIFYAFLSGIIWADVAYLPKHQSTPRIVLRINKIFGTKLFTTIEGNMCDTSKKSMIDSFNGVKNMQNYFSLIPNIYGITKHIIQNATCGVKLNNNPLYLGVEKADFISSKKKRLQNIIFIGSLIRRKGVEDFLKLASLYPDLNFYIIGDGPLKNELENKSTTNVIFFGKLNSYEISNHLQNMDLHILLSRSEGFPKVILETASSAIPSILYDDYGADSWINHSENGFVVSNFEEVKNTIDNLIKNPEILIRNSENVLELAEKFDWKIIIKSWEKVIDNLK